MAKEKPAKAAKPDKAGGMAWLIIWPIVIMMSAVFPPLAILVAGMVPTLVARFVDPHPERALTVCAGAGNAVGCIYWLLVSVLHQQTDWGYVSGLLMQPMTWLVLLGTTGAGWGLWLVVPPLVATQVTRHQQTMRAKLVRAQEKMAKEWSQGIHAP